jgi:hypothetical protein
MTDEDRWATSGNGRIHMEFTDGEAAIRRRLNVLDGTTKYAYSLWKCPPGVEFDHINLKKWPTDYLQTAGSRDRMTVELRRTDTPQGVPSHVVLGRPGTSIPEVPQMETIEWDQFEVVVMAHEVFSADEAYDAFVAYLEDQTLSGYPQRPL